MNRRPRSRRPSRSSRHRRRPRLGRRRGQTMTIAPTHALGTRRLQTVTVQAGALAQTGQPLARPARAVFLTRGTTTGTIVADETRRQARRGGDGLRRELRRSGGSRRASRPPSGSIHRSLATIRRDGPDGGPGTLHLRPDEASPLRHRLQARRGAASAIRTGCRSTPSRMAVRTIKAPGVVRFRPRDDSRERRGTSVHVGPLHQAMDRGATARALSVKIGGKAIKGKIRWAEHDTVLVFTPIGRPARTARPCRRPWSITAKQRPPGAISSEPAKAVFETVPRPKPWSRRRA